MTTHSLPIASGNFETWPPDRPTVRCPYGFFSSLRETAPVYRYPADGPGGQPFYIVTAWQPAEQILRNTGAFTNAFLPEPREIDLEPWPLPEIPRIYDKPNIFFTDGADHAAKRRWSLSFVDPQRLKAYRPLVEAEATKLISDFAADGHCEFMSQYTDKLSMYVIRKLMGLPEEADPMIKRFSAAIPVIDNNPDATSSQLQEVADATADLVGICADAVLDRVGRPRDDFITEIVQMQSQADGTLDPNTLAKHIMVMLFGADHAMGAHLAQVMTHIARDPDLQARIRTDRSLILPVSQEALRYENPVPWLFRHCREATSVDGVSIPAGSTVLVATAAANYDPAVFPAPEKFDSARPRLERDHLALGRGAHRCVGAPMARMQVDVTVNRMLDLLQDIRLDFDRSDLNPHYSLGFRVPHSVHLTFTAL